MRKRWIWMCLVVAAAAVAAGLWWRHSRSPTASHPTTAAVSRDGGSPAGGVGLPPSARARDPEPPGALRLEGLVVDEHDQPVAGATLEISTRPPRQLTSDSDGSFAIDRLLATTYRVTAWKDDRYAQPIELAVRPATEPLIVRLELGAAMEVRVIDDTTEAAIVGATVDDGQRVATTDTAGVATLRGLGPWFFAAEVRAAGFAPATLALSLPHDPGARHRRTVRLVRGAPVRGRVVAADGSAVPGVTVVISGDASGEAVTDTAGAWGVPALGAGHYAFAVDDDAHGLARVELDGDGATARDGVELRLARGATLAGVVVDAAGAPQAGASVTLQIARNYEQRHATTVGDGRFVVRGLPAVSLGLYAQLGAAASPVVMVDLKQGDRNDVRLVVAPATIRGVVVDPSGAPVPEARVSAIGDTDVSILLAASDVADGAGRFELGPLADASYRLTAEWPDAPDRNRYLQGEPTLARAGAADVRLVLAPVGAITGVVTRDGQAVERLALAISDFEPGLSFAEPEAQVTPGGRFTRSAVPPGTWVVRIVGEGFVGKTVTGVVVTAGQTTDLGTLTVEGGATVAGRVVDAAGAPVADAEVALSNRIMLHGDSFLLSDDPRKAALLGAYAARTDRDGQFAIAGVGPPTRGGPLVIVALHARRGVSAATTVTLPTAPMTLALAATGAIEGTVVDDSVAPHLSVEITSAAAGYPIVAFVGSDGRFRAARVPPGPAQVVVEAMSRDGRRASEPVSTTVAAGATASVTVTLPPAVSSSTGRR